MHSKSEKKSQLEKEAQEEKLEVYKFLYIFRYPFSITALNWAAVMSVLFGLHNYRQHSHLMRNCLESSHQRRDCWVFGWLSNIHIFVYQKLGHSSSCQKVVSKVTKKNSQIYWTMNCFCARFIRRNFHQIFQKLKMKSCIMLSKNMKSIF